MLMRNNSVGDDGIGHGEETKFYSKETRTVDNLVPELAGLQLMDSKDSNNFSVRKKSLTKPQKIGEAVS